ncbi:hypothetical protein BaRGS_00020850 [Batillaria attramentaria]|uniref:BTB domain-containing protein n=1 Tax=Batillaria attramentaria TaxID=370345 RepID=A0ABD0KLA9_9CAEN
MTYQLGSSFDNLQNTVNNSMGDGVGRLHADQELCDVTVTVGDESFLCHKVVLASVSRFFQALFRNEPTSDHVPIDNDYVSANAFGVFVDMLYKKLDGVTDANTANDVLIAAMFLQVQFLQEHCERFLVNDMTPDTCLDMWQFADSYELKILEEGARAMAMSQFNEDAFSNAFGSLPLHFLLILLSSNNLVVNEDNVCERIVYWVRKNAQAREQYLPQLLPFVNFLNVSDSYRETLRQQALQFSSIESYLSEALTFKLETATKINSVTRREILARQDKRVTSAEVDMHVVAIGGVGTDGRSTRTVRIVETDNKTEDKPRQLEMLDVDPGIGFATCVWRNELYISGGSKKPEMFKVYNSGADAWKSLPNLLQRRKGHAIVAVGWNIYILGGEEAATVSSCLEETDEEDEGVPEEQKEKEESVPTKESEAAVEITAPSLLSDISMYSTRTRTWSKFGQLTEPRTDVSAAVLGHRIYVFGGKNADNQPTSLVECVDTLTGSVYLAGRLPSPTSGVRALSDGGSVFVTLPEVGVYQMKEHHHFTDSEKMQEATTQDTTPLPAFGEKDVVHKDSAVFKSEDRRRMSEVFQKSRHAIPEEKQQEADACNDADSIAQLLGPAKAPEAEVKNEDANAEEKSLLVQSDTNHSMALRKGDQRGNGADHQPTVTFRKLAVLPERRHFGACIYKGNVLVGGGLDQNGERLSDFKFFGSVTMASTLALEGGLSHFGLHVLEVPKLTDKATFRFTFRPDKLDGKNSLESHRVKINRFTW